MGQRCKYTASTFTGCTLTPPPPSSSSSSFPSLSNVMALLFPATRLTLQCLLSNNEAHVLNPKVFPWRGCFTIWKRNNVAAHLGLVFFFMCSALHWPHVSVMLPVTVRIGLLIFTYWNSSLVLSEGKIASQISLVAIASGPYWKCNGGETTFFNSSKEWGQLRLTKFLMTFFTFFFLNFDYFMSSLYSRKVSAISTTRKKKKVKRIVGGTAMSIFFSFKYTKALSNTKCFLPKLNMLPLHMKLHASVHCFFFTFKNWIR